MIAIVEAYKAGLLGRGNWTKNILAGIIVGIVALPLSMAFAIASGARPESGLYTAIIAGGIVGLFGGSRTQIAGPTGAFIVILAEITGKYGFAGLQFATFMAGLILMVMGLLRLGAVIKYIPEPVIAGFTSGIGVIIFVGQWKSFFGLPVNLPLDARFHNKLTTLVTALPECNWPTVALGLFSLSLILFSPKIKYIKAIPGPLVAMVSATLILAVHPVAGIATIGSVFGAIPQGLPPLTLSHLSFDSISDLLGPAFTIALLGAIESLLSASAADGMANTKHNPNQELIGQGLANFIVPLLGGFAATGAIARTATNIRSGGNSPLGSITHAILLLIIILFLAPLAAYIPLCALAAILFVVAYRMSDVRHFIYILKHSPFDDKLILGVTFLLTVLSDLVIAVNIGVILAMLLFMRRMTLATQIKEEPLSTDALAPSSIKFPHDVIVYSINGPLFFGVAERFAETLKATNSKVRTIVFNFDQVPFIDFSGLRSFQETLGRLSREGIKIYAYGVNAEIRAKFSEVGVTAALKGQKVFNDLAEIYQMEGLSS
jgi:SulP family sulfate permease